MFGTTGTPRVMRQVALATAGAAMGCMGFLAVTSAGEAGGLNADHVRLPLNPNGSGELTPGPSVAPSKVDCNDPNNSINCQGPHLDSPLVPGTAAPGSPFRD